MIQALDLARENAALKDEVTRLRKELAGLGQTHGSNGAEPSDSFTLQWPDELGIDHAAGASVGMAARLLLVMPRHLALDCGLSGDGSAGLPHFSVIVDRRLTERRRAVVAYRGHERRRRDRRSDERSTPGAVVVSLR
jgi:hypothetical protein